eukprot:Nitzschia sp. Nitz4//scaffold205_size38804//171//3349//NITZ4_007639-RA/size38804-augustus-gene-0.57-mRNA-1//-1//CDS//3329541498//3877//frame0
MKWTLLLLVALSSIPVCILAFAPFFALPSSNIHPLVSRTSPPVISVHHHEPSSTNPFHPTSRSSTLRSQLRLQQTSEPSPPSHTTTPDTIPVAVPPPTNYSAQSLLNDFTQGLEDIRKRINDGSIELIANVTAAMDQAALPSKVPSETADQLAAYFLSVTQSSQQAHLEEIQQKLEELERRLVEPLEQVAFSDAPLYYTQQQDSSWTSSSSSSSGSDSRNSQEPIVWAGRNSTLKHHARTKTRDLIRNLNVAPIYYSVALLYRWATKVTAPPIMLLSALKGVATVVGTKRSRPRRRFSRGTSGANTTSSGTYQETVGDAEAMHAGWERIGNIANQGKLARKWATLRRSAEVWVYFSSFYLKDRRITRKLQSGAWTEERASQERSKLGAEITQNLLRLGPTFIKLGQLLSTRIDIVAKEYIEQLKLLQDNVPPFSGELAKQVIEEELGKPIGEIFDSFDTRALAGASLGQVHLATKGNQTFAVKVQRQHLQQLFEVDLAQLRQLAKFADAIDVSVEGGPLDKNTKRDWLSIFNENKRLLYEEIDYGHELRNAERFRSNFAGPKYRHIRTPKTYPEYSTKKVLCMEYAPGIKITDIEKIQELGLDPVDISIKSATAFLEQLCRHGFFHCDPHPGNLAVEKGADGKARLIFYDFGMMDSFGATERKGFVDLAFAVYYDSNVKDACDALERMGMLRNDPNIDRIAVERAGQDFINRFQETLSQKKRWEYDTTTEEEKQLARQRRKALGEEFLSLNRDSPFVFPPTWTFVFRAFFSLDGIGKSLNPEFDMTKIMLPYLKELLDLKDGSAFKTMALRIGKRFGVRPVDFYNMFTQSRRTANIDDIVSRLERGELKLRVRAMDVERQNERNRLVLQNSYEGIILGILLQGGLSFYTAGSGIRGAKLWSRLLLGAASILAARVPLNLLKLKKMDGYNAHYGK